MKKKICFWFALGILSLFLSCISTTYDYDLFARLIVGEQFIEHGIIHFQDFLSYTPTHFWYDHEWGSGVVFYLFLKYLGAFGLIFLQAIFFFFISFFVVKIQKLQKHSYPTSILFMAIFMILFWKQNATIVRCHCFSFLFFSMFLYFLEKHRKKGTKLIWLIPFIVVIWNNLHGGVVAGLGLIFMYLIGEVLQKKPWKEYIILLASSFPLLIINPYGMKYLNFLFSATTMTRKYIVEWWPILAARHVLYYLPMGLYSVYGYILSIQKSISEKKADYTKLIILTVTLAQGLLHVKLLSLSLIVVAALCYNEISDSFKFIKSLLKKCEKPVYNAIFSLILIIPVLSPMLPRIETNKYPITEVEFLRINNIKGNLLANFGFGSYVSYKLYPQNKIYMDGRYEEVYNDKEYMTLRDYELGEPNWKDILTKYNTEIIFSKNNSQVFNLIYNDPDWNMVYRGNSCGVFIKKELTAKKYIEPSYDINYYKKHAFDGYFGNKIRKNIK